MAPRTAKCLSDMCIAARVTLAAALLVTSVVFGGPAAARSPANAPAPLSQQQQDASESRPGSNADVEQNSALGPSSSGVTGEPAGPPAALRLIDQYVRDLAREAASKPYVEPTTAEDRAEELSYDDYRKIRFLPEKARWRGESHGFELHALPMGWLFKHPIDLSIISGGKNAPADFRLSDFDHPPEMSRLPDTEVPVLISGFRINGRLNSVDVSDEIIVFQGASYFRALARNHRYGLSARGLAIATASPAGEEFPAFTKFWVEQPEEGAASFRIHALLDSASTTGAYHFEVTPGKETVVDVKAILFPRKEMSNVGLAPLTSMNLVAPVTPGRVRDFRPRVHDSQALAIHNADGERVWRPLANPTSLQVSEFQGDSPRGFGLIQRVREFSAYEDLEAHYEKRPSAWIEPKGELFRKGSVVLVEIPTEEEVHDNIVAFWRPAEKLKPGKSYDFSYKIRWRNDVPDQLDVVWVQDTRVGRAYHIKDEAVRFVVDYQTHPAIGEDLELQDPVVTASHGEISGIGIQRNAETGGVRATFRLHTAGIDWSELRMSLPPIKGKPSETWLFRWTRGRE